MAGTFQRACTRVARRAMAAGLSGLAVALLVGVMAFALTTSPSGNRDETATRYLVTASRVVEMSSVAVPRAEAAASVLRDALPMRGQPFQTSRDDASELLSVEPGHVDVVLVRAIEEFEDEERAALAALLASTSVAPPAMAEVRPAADDGTVTATRAGPVAEPVAEPHAEPDLGPGDRVTATLSFYYCERGVEGLHPGDGGGFCGAMRDGTVVYPGAAACAYRYLGQQFRIIGDPLDRVYRCADTGSAVHGLHRDIWFMDSDEGWTWQSAVGRTAEIEILPE